MDQSLKTQQIEIENLTCPVPLRDYPNIVLGHGGGGKLSAELVEHLFLPAFRNPTLASLSDAAVLAKPQSGLAFTTDSYVVRPLFFPGGSIGDLAVNGTVNDLSVSGAKPLYMSAAFIIEEGFPMQQLVKVVHAMAKAAEQAGVMIVTGDTKVVDRGHGDGCFINTAGVGELIDGGRVLSPAQIRVGDAIVVSGTIGDHGMAVMSVRDGLQFDAVIESDSAPLNSLVAKMLESTSGIRVMRDPTRGGIASSLNELALAANLGIVIDESQLPITPTTQAACDLLGMDAMFVANEGKLLAFVAAQEAEQLVSVMRAHPHGTNAAIIGHVTDQHQGLVVARTAIGGKRVIAMQIGEQLPRIC